MMSKLFLSLTDQFLVSGGNFLTIAIGAYILPFSEQGKLAYVLSVYMATVLFNVAAFFAVAPVVKHEVAAPNCYRDALFRWQAILAVITALAITSILHFWGEHIGWEVSISENVLLMLFLCLQQLADFKRRAAYVFDGIAEACQASFWTYGLRIGLLIILHPLTILEVLTILAAGATISAIAAVLKSRKGIRFLKGGEQKAMINLHLRLSKWSILNAPLGWTCFFFPVFIVGAIVSEKAAAILASIRSVGSAANVVLELLETYIPVWLASTKTMYGSNGLKDASYNLFRGGFILWMTGLVVIWFGGDILIRWSLGQPYVQFNNILLISWLANGIHFAGRVIGLHYRTAKDMRVELLGSIGGIIGLVMAIPVIRKYELEGAAWAYVIISAGIFMVQLLYLLYLKWVGGEHNVRTV